MKSIFLITSLFSNVLTSFVAIPSRLYFLFVPIKLITPWFLLNLKLKNPKIFKFSINYTPIIKFSIDGFCKPILINSLILFLSKFLS